MQDSAKRENRIMRITLFGAITNCVLTLAKVAAGIVGHSAAMIADGVHSLSDLVSDFIVVVFVHISSKANDSGHDYGHGKFETLATLIVSVLLLIVGVKLMRNGVDAICLYMNGESLPTPGYIALYMALASIIIKEILYRTTLKVGHEVDSEAVVANAWHHRADAISSVGSLVGIAGAIFLGHKWVVLDPLAGCIISIFIFVVACKMAMRAINELMEASLPEQERQEILKLIADVNGIEDVHELKTRRNGQSIIIDVHIVVNPLLTVAEAHEMTIEAERCLRNRFGNSSQIYIHIEPSESAL